MRITRSALMLIFALSVLIPGSMSVAHAKPASATASAQTQTPFLTLPFVPNSGMSILSGWYYSSSGGFHGGIDYIKGSVNNLSTWSTFQVVASADGEACGNCSGRQGNAVWVKHNIGGKTYYTYYGHLASIAQGIPIGSQSRTVKVKRGQLLGMAGDTGAGRGVLHLHFALYNSSSQPLDPYSIGKLRQYYPAPTSAQPGVGWFLR